MPSTFVGLVIFVISLAPGLVYLLLYERAIPHRSLSAFRETALVVCVSLAADAAVLVLFAVLRAWAPAATLDVGAVARNPDGYLRTGYTEVIWWSFALLSTATILAAWVGSGLVRRWLALATSRLPPRLQRLRVTPTATPHLSGLPPWWVTFHEHPERDVYLQCVLNDESVLSGPLRYFSNVAGDTADRDIVLNAQPERPLKFRAAGSNSTIERVNGAVVISARDISRIYVSYVTKKSGQEPK